MKNIYINKIRKKLDKIDIKLLDTIKQRSLLIDKILKLKKNKFYFKKHKKKIYKG